MAVLKCESRTTLNAVNTSDRQALFCSVIIILKMVSLDTLFLCFTGQQAWPCS